MISRFQATGLALLGCLLSALPALGLDLEQAKVEVLRNGLTLATLEDHTLPVVSVQMLYRVGARTEEIGKTGLAHFVEHMAFRATRNFPQTEVVSAIYGIGGEWHGYTWIDQTTYFATAPREHLDLLLRIEADRMARLLMPPAELAAERGAVLSELHGYANDPGTLLLDGVAATSFLQHPYRHNTIGWESDVERLEHRDVEEFYRRHYHPANAVLAVVGDVETHAVREAVERLFSPMARRDATPPPRTVEPEQEGVRRFQISGSERIPRFVIAYRAPSVRSRDWPAFLVLQEVLGGSEGVSFLQNAWGVPVRSGARLGGIVGDLTTWYPPSFDRYLFVIAGSADGDRTTAEVEDLIEQRIAALRSREIDQDELTRARARVGRQLIFDLETTEDAAHQLASYLGYGALPGLLDLPGAVERVTAADLQRLVLTYLQPDQRTIGWYEPVAPSAAREPVQEIPETEAPRTSSDSVSFPQQRDFEALSADGASAPVIARLSNGVPVIFQRISLTPTACLRILVPSTATTFPAGMSRDWPIWDHTSIERRFLPRELESEARQARLDLDSAPERSLPAAETTEDPAVRLDLAVEELLGVERQGPNRQPLVIGLVGDLQEATALEILERTFGDFEPGDPPTAQTLALSASEKTVVLPVAKAQARLGYVVPAPPPGSADALAWRMILYVLSHGYEGRLGVEAISRRGLLYYIDSSYRSDGPTAWVSLAMGVDPAKLGALKRLLGESLEQLQSHPPTDAELDEARQHLIGRRRSAAQSNAEISAALVREWAELGRLRSESEFARAVLGVSREEVLEAVPAFVSGAVIEVVNPE